MSASALRAVMVREGKIRATNTIFIFWDLVYPLGYLLVFSIGVSRSMGNGKGYITSGSVLFFPPQLRSSPSCLRTR